jgi:poly(A) polymerase
MALDANAPDPRPAKTSDPADALAVVRRLREAGHVAYWAGGCVRDLLLGREPKDYDVATDAPPDRVRALFSRTEAVGAAFGVILVRHRRSQIEVATFRTEGPYLDGRRPSAVHFTTAQEDAKRRDFTINGLFLDPLAPGALADQVIDYVGGREDLERRVIRAIGEPDERFEEDHLRLLRAVRFAARFGFTIDPQTAAAIRRHAPRLARISPERIGEELRAMLPPPTRGRAWQLLNELDLAVIVFRFVDLPPGEPQESRGWDTFIPNFAADETVPFGLALAAVGLQYEWWALPAGVDFRALLERSAAQHLAGALRRALRFSNDESEQVEQTLEGLSPLVRDELPTVAALKRFLARPTAPLSRRLLAALTVELGSQRVESVQYRLAELEKGDFAPPAAHHRRRPDRRGAAAGTDVQAPARPGLRCPTRRSRADAGRGNGAGASDEPGERAVAVDIDR